MSLEEKLKTTIREVPDFPIKGINFKDISPIFLNPGLVRQSTFALASHWNEKGVNKILGIESRGFLFGLGMAAEMNAGFVVVRKAGKLPPDTEAISYSLEYGEATIEVVKASIQPGDRVVIHDDLLATGGTASAAAKLARNQGAEVVGFSFLVELSFIPGREKLLPFSRDIHSLVTY
jgi:adenine phosphoribosyltransferase